MANTFKAINFAAEPASAGTPYVMYTAAGSTTTVVLGLILANIHTASVTAEVELVSTTANGGGANNVAKVKFYCESSNAHAQTLQAQPHSAGSSAVVTLPVATGTLIGTGDTGTLPVAAIDIDGGTDIGADLTTSDLIVVDDGAGGTNKKAALSRVSTFIENQGFSKDDPTALAIALG